MFSCLIGSISIASSKAYTEDIHLEEHFTHYSSREKEDQKNQSTSSLGPAFLFVKLTMWASHRNYHTSYTRTVYKQGRKHIVKYVAAPMEGCKNCEIKAEIDKY